MEDGQVCTKDEVTQYMASQGLVYSGLDKHFDDWFDNYRLEFGFENIGNDEYIYHEDEW
jgi:hypothetical protein